MFTQKSPKELLADAFAKGKILLVGVDPPADLSLLPSDAIVTHGNELDVEETLYQFGVALVDAASDVAVGIKPNIGFFERHRRQGGLRALDRIVVYCKKAYPHLLVIMDSKRNDIGKTAEAQTDGVFSYGVHGSTVNGYLGTDGITPFISYDESSRLIFPLIRTSNKSAVKTQDVQVCLNPEEFLALVNGPAASGRGLDFAPHTMRYFEMVAHLIGAHCAQFGNCGGVVGATVPEQMAAVRAILKTAPFIVPGFGPQGGDMQNTLNAGLTEDGSGLLCNFSSGISEAFTKEEYAGLSFAASTRKAALKAHADLARCRRQTLALRIFERTNALLYGHYVYKSLRHGGVYVAKDEALRDPAHVQIFGRLLAEVLEDHGFDVVLGPADPGIGLSQFTALALQESNGVVPALYASKSGDDFILKPDQQELVKDKRVAVVDDVLTKGTTFNLVKGAIEAAGGEVTVLAVLWNRGGLTAEQAGVPVESLVTRQYDDFDEADCPQCQEGVPVNTDHGHGAKYLATQATESVER